MVHACGRAGHRSSGQGHVTTCRHVWLLAPPRPSPSTFDALLGRPIPQCSLVQEGERRGTQWGRAFRYAHAGDMHALGNPLPWNVGENCCPPQMETLILWHTASARTLHLRVGWGVGSEALGGGGGGFPICHALPPYRMLWFNGAARLSVSPQRWSRCVRVGGFIRSHRLLSPVFLCTGCIQNLPGEVPSAL